MCFQFPDLQTKSGFFKWRLRIPFVQKQDAIFTKTGSRGDSCSGASGIPIFSERTLHFIIFGILWGKPRKGEEGKELKKQKKWKAARANLQSCQMLNRAFFENLWEGCWLVDYCWLNPLPLGMEEWLPAGLTPSSLAMGMNLWRWGPGRPAAPFPAHSYDSSALSNESLLGRRAEIHVCPEKLEASIWVRSNIEPKLYPQPQTTLPASAPDPQNHSYADTRCRGSAQS